MIFTLALLFVSLVSADVIAQKKSAESKQEKERPMRQDQMKERGQNPRSMKGFTKEQKEEIKELRFEHLKATTPLKNELNVLRARQKSLMAGNNPDQAQINLVIDDIAQVNAQLLRLDADHQMKFRAILTEEQRVKMDAMRANADQNGAQLRQGQQGRRQSEGGRQMPPRRPLKDR